MGTSRRSSEGSQSGYFSGYGDGTSLAERSLENGGTQINGLIFWYYEPQSTTGHGVRLKNSNGNFEAGAGTDNPQFVKEDSGGTNRTGSSGSYGSWTKVEFTFDWGSNSVTIEWSNNNSDTYNGTLKEGVDVEQVELWTYSGGVWGAGSYDQHNYWDNIQIDGLTQPLFVSSTISDTSSKSSQITNRRNPTIETVETSTTSTATSRSRRPSSTIDAVSNVTVYSTVYSRVHSYPTDTEVINSSTENVRSIVTTSRDLSINNIEVIRERLISGNLTDLSTIHSKSLIRKNLVSTIDGVSDVVVYSTVFSRVHSYPTDTEKISSKSERVRTTVTTTEETEKISSSPDRDLEVIGQPEDMSTVNVVIALTPIKKNNGTGKFRVVNSGEVAFLNANTRETVFRIENKGEGKFFDDNTDEKTLITENEGET
jgi:hypothetical protein